MSPDDLIAFSQRVEQAFLAKQIKAPVHLCGGNEAPLIEIFEKIRPQDWVFSGWRSAYHALLKGIPEEWVFSEILASRSMYLINRQHKFICSSIVGGVLPIACGVAMGIARNRKCVGENKKDGYTEKFIEVLPDEQQVWVFVGDMTAQCGIYLETVEYSRRHCLPINFVIEDNGFSTDTPTQVVWGKNHGNFARVAKYAYKRRWPHVGVGQHVSF